MGSKKVPWHSGMHIIVQLIYKGSARMWFQSMGRICCMSSRKSPLRRFAPGLHCLTCALAWHSLTKLFLPFRTPSDPLELILHGVCSHARKFDKFGPVSHPTLGWMAAPMKDFAIKPRVQDPSWAGGCGACSCRPLSYVTWSELPRGRGKERRRKFRRGAVAMRHASCCSQHP